MKHDSTYWREAISYWSMQLYKASLSETHRYTWCLNSLKAALQNYEECLENEMLKSHETSQQ